MSIKGAELAAAGRRAFLGFRLTAGMASGCLDIFLYIQNLCSFFKTPLTLFLFFTKFSGTMARRINAYY
jgi:hypothetical protein